MYNDKQEVYNKLKSILYDYNYENTIDWQCLSCKWFQVEESQEDYFKQEIIFACKTEHFDKLPSFLVIASVNIPKENKIFDIELEKLYNSNNKKKINKDLNFKVKQLIIHPGDPNVIKKCYINNKLLATKSDNNNVLIWDIDKHLQKNQNTFSQSINNIFNNEDGVVNSQIPDLTLKCEEKNINDNNLVNFSLDWSKTSYRIGSGSKDKHIYIWDIEDYQSSLGNKINTYVNKRVVNNINTNQDINMTINHKYQLKGHSDSVEDISFSPESREQLVSVGQDRCIIGWDIRLPHQDRIVYRLDQIFNSGINVVDWNIQRPNLIALGSETGLVKILDNRQLHQIVNEVQLKSSIQCLNWNNNLLGIASDNLYIYDNHQNNIIFTHLTSSALNDFDWNYFDQNSIITSLSPFSDESPHSTQSPGLIQIFRPNHLILKS